MSRVNKIQNNRKFKNDNLNNWREVSKFWLTGNLSQRKDLINFYKKKIEGFISGNNLQILDVGCGDGWIIEVLESIYNINFNYTGIDYNKTFVDFLNSQKKNKHVTFEYIDIEEDIILNKIGKFDIIINSFSLFEMPNYEKALRNQVEMLKPKGSILIFSIDPLTQIMAISENEQEFQENCVSYAKIKNQGYYRKLIDTGNGFANLQYLGILHTLSDYFKVLKLYNFSIVDIDEVNLLDDIVPKIYQYAEFKR